MNETYPIHLMIKPEGLENFTDFIHGQLELLEALSGRERTVNIVTRLTPEQVQMLYPEEKIPKEFKKFLSEHPSEHLILHGTKEIYELAKTMKGKVKPESGLRGSLVAAAERIGLPLERWQNFVHSTESIEESYPICAHFTKDLPTCTHCAAKELCYGAKGSAMPETSLKP